jgi:hypothetical protein
MMEPGHRAQTRSSAPFPPLQLCHCRAGPTPTHPRAMVADLEQLGAGEIIWALLRSDVAC